MIVVVENIAMFITHAALLALWIGSLSAAVHRTPAHLDGDLGPLAERLLREIGTPYRA